VKESYSRSISMQCPTCGGSDFTEGDSEVVTCSRCERAMTKSTLLSENGARIDEEVEALKADVLRDVRADFKKMFSKWK